MKNIAKKPLGGGDDGGRKNKKGGVHTHSFYQITLPYSYISIFFILHSSVAVPVLSRELQQRGREPGTAAPAEEPSSRHRD